MPTRQLAPYGTFERKNQLRARKERAQLREARKGAALLKRFLRPLKLKRPSRKKSSVSGTEFPTLATSTSPNIGCIIHGMLVFMTGGLWLLVWLPLVVLRGRSSPVQQHIQKPLPDQNSLFGCNWKAMRGGELEQFLKQVFDVLGYQATVTSGVGDQGADLIVCANGRKMAVQVKGYVSSVSNSAVQEALAGKAFYNCDACAVITNSRFSQSAKDLAAKAGCVLIDEDGMPAFVMGQCPYFPARSRVHQPTVESRATDGRSTVRTGLLIAGLIFVFGIVGLTGFFGLLIGLANLSESPSRPIPIAVPSRPAPVPTSIRDEDLAPAESALRAPTRSVEPEASGCRTWKDATERFSVSAEFAGAVSGNVKLRKADGSTVVVPLERLSEEDQTWIKVRARSSR